MLKVDVEQIVKIINVSKEETERVHPERKICITHSFSKRVAGSLVGYLKGLEHNGIDVSLKQELRDRNELLSRLIRGIYGKPIKFHNRTKEKIWNRILRMDKDMGLLSQIKSDTSKDGKK